MLVRSQLAWHPPTEVESTILALKTRTSRDRQAANAWPMELSSCFLIHQRFSVNILTLLLVFCPPGRGFHSLLMEPLSMRKAIVPVACLLLFTVQAEARPH